MICSEAAFIERGEYVLPSIPRSADKKEQDLLFRKWQADAIGKYPQLLSSYDLLVGCWLHYTTTK